MTPCHEMHTAGVVVESSRQHNVSSGMGKEEDRNSTRAPIQDAALVRTAHDWRSCRAGSISTGRSTEAMPWSQPGGERFRMRCTAKQHPACMRMGTQFYGGCSTNISRSIILNARGDGGYALASLVMGGPLGTDRVWTHMRRARVPGKGGVGGRGTHGDRAEATGKSVTIAFRKISLVRPPAARRRRNGKGSAPGDPGRRG